MPVTGQLQITTPSDSEIAITRVFNAPRKLVFQAMTTPELVKRWLLGPPGWSMPVCEIDLRVGGSYRFGWLGEGGKAMEVNGVYRDVRPPERCVQTEKFSPAWYPGEAIVAMDLVEEAGRTTLITTVTYESCEIRDRVLGSNMESGVAASYDRLAEVVASL